jgi:orotidine-5'-phosphate decarboxylase
MVEFAGRMPRPWRSTAGPGVARRAPFRKTHGRAIADVPGARETASRIRGVIATSARERLDALHARGLHLCVGLDTDPARIPDIVAPDASVAERVVAFNRAIVEATSHVVCAYKPNIAFYEALGEPGFTALAATVGFIREVTTEPLIIVDAKRADIGTTNQGYIQAIFDHLEADAVTVHPYLGGEALAPFLAQRDKLIFVLARTSNPGAGEFQNLKVGGVPLYRHVARTVAREWNDNGNCGLVVGATYAEELEEIRADVGPELPILVPGVGAQGGDLQAAVRLHQQASSRAFVINASRSVLYAGVGAGFADAARAEAERLHHAIYNLTAIH